MFRNSLFVKILLIFTLPALGILYFSTILVYEKINTLSDINNIKKDIGYILTTEKLINSLQKERGFAVIYLSSKKDKQNYILQKQKTDNYYKEFLQEIENINKSTNHLTISTQKIQKIFSNFSFLRQQIDTQQLDAYNVILEYSNINESLLDTIYTIKPIKSATKFNTKFSYIINILLAKESAGVERALTSINIVLKSISEENYKKLLYTYSMQEINIKEFLLKADIKEIEFYNKLQNTLYTKKVYEIRNNLKELIIKDKLDLQIWWEISTLRIENLSKVHNFVSSDILKLAQEIQKEASSSQILSLSFLFICFATLISLLFVLKTIVFNQQKSFNKLEKQQNIYKILSRVNKLILKVKNRKKLFFKVLNTINNNEPSIKLSMLYKVKKTQKRLILVKGENSLKIEFIEEEATKNCIVKKAISSSKNIILNSKIEKLCTLTPKFISENHLKSVAVFPIKKFDKVVALLVLFSNNKNFFDREVEILFNKMIIDIEYALEKIDYEKNKAKQEEELIIASYAFESNEPMIITNNDAKIINVNQAFCKVMGYEKDEIKGQNPKIFKSEEHSEEFYQNMWNSILTKGTWSSEVYNKKKNGENIPLKATITAIKDKQGNIKHYLSQYSDISEQKLKQQYLEYQATHDSLTALPNRLLLFDRINHSINKITRHKTFGGLIFIDLDNFKTINDTMGHETGDILLKEVSKKLQETVRKEDTIARIGGDEFIILADFIGTDKASARNNMQILASKIKGALNNIHTINGYENISTPSIGITLFNNDSFNANELIKQADTAMYLAKRAGKNTIRFFE